MCTLNPVQQAENTLSGEFHFKSLLQFALPTICMMLFMGLYTVIDTVFVAHYIHTDALSAMHIVCPMINLVVGFGTMLASGGSAVIARKMGNGNEARARQDFTLVIIAGILMGIFIAAFGTLHIEDLIWSLGASKRLFPYCKEYLLILLFFTPASILQILFQSFAVTAGRPKLGMAVSIGAGVMNIVLDYVFIVFLGWGLAGSALGTGIGYFVSAITGSVFFLHNKGPLYFEKPVLDFKVLAESCLNGSSEMVSQVATAVTTFLFNAAMMQFLGEDGVAAITILIYMQFFLTALYIGFSMGVAPVISYSYGSENHVQLKRLFRISIFFISVLSVWVTVFAVYFGSSLAGIFSQEGTNVHKIAQEGFMIFPFGFIFSGMNIFASAAFTALSNGKNSAIISFCRTFVFISFSLLFLPRILHVTGIWIAVPLAEFLTLFVSAFFFWRDRKLYGY